MRLNVVHDSHRRPSPHGDLTGSVLLSSVALKIFCNAGSELLLVKRYVIIAEGKYCVAPVDDLLGGHISVGNVRTEVDVYEGREFSLLCGNYCRNGEGKRVLTDSAHKLERIVDRFACTEVIEGRFDVYRHMVRLRGNNSVLLLLEYLLYLLASLFKFGYRRNLLARIHNKRIWYTALA